MRSSTPPPVSSASSSTAASEWTSSSSSAESLSHRSQQGNSVTLPMPPNLLYHRFARIFPIYWICTTIILLAYLYHPAWINAPPASGQYSCVLSPHPHPSRHARPAGLDPQLRALLLSRLLPPALHAPERVAHRLLIVWAAAIVLLKRLFGAISYQAHPLAPRSLRGPGIPRWLSHLLPLPIPQTAPSRRRPAPHRRPPLDSRSHPLQRPRPPVGHQRYRGPRLDPDAPLRNLCRTPPARRDRTGTLRIIRYLRIFDPSATGRTPSTSPTYRPRSGQPTLHALAPAFPTPSSSILCISLPWYSSSATLATPGSKDP